jgi:hypothetical protein
MDEVYAFNPFRPAYNQSWSAKIGVTIPAALDNLSGADWYAEGAIGVIGSTAAGGNYIVSNGLEIGNDQNPAGRKYNPEFYINNQEVGDSIGVTPTSLESTTLTLNYDATTKIIDMGNQDGVLRTLDVSSFADMSQYQNMLIIIGFSTYSNPPGLASGLSIPSTMPIMLNSFAVTTPVPEADSYAMMMAGLGLVGVVIRRKSKKAG